MDKCNIDDMSEKLSVRAKDKATISAFANFIPIPAFGVAADIMLLVEETNQYLKEFQINDASLQGFSDQYNIPYRELLDQLTFCGAIVTGKMAMKEFIIIFVKENCKKKGASVVAGFVPIVGNLFSAAMSYVSTGYILVELIRQCSEDATRLSTYISKKEEEREKRKPKKKRSRKCVVS